MHDHATFFALCLKAPSVFFHFSAKMNISTQIRGLWYPFTNVWTSNICWSWSLLRFSLPLPPASPETSEHVSAFQTPADPELRLEHNLPFSSDSFPWVPRQHKAPIPVSYLGMHDGRARLSLMTTQHVLQCTELNIIKYKNKERSTISKFHFYNAHCRNICICRRDKCTASVLDGGKGRGQVGKFEKQKQEYLTWRRHWRKRGGKFFCTTTSRPAGTGTCRGSGGGGKGCCSNGIAGRAWGQSKEGMSFLQKTLPELSYWARTIILTEKVQRTGSVNLSDPRLGLWKNKPQEARLLLTNWTQIEFSCWNT